MTLTMLFGLFGGLGLFIYGMKQMSEGLQKAAGKRLRHILARLTTNPLMGVFVGTGVTAVIQSSSATTVMVVGFVNAGLMTLSQSIGVIMGANIGTTITAQLIAFKISHYALHAIAIGAGLFLFSKKGRTKQLGQVILGFGILFLGMTIMKDTMKPLRESVVFINAMKQFSNSPLLGLLLGTGITIILQSSSASIGIILSLLSVGIINYWAAVPMLLGGNIGTTITAILSSIGANRTAKKAAAAHFTFNFVGSSVVVALFYIIPNFADLIHDMILKLSTLIGETPTPERLLANTHSFFNILNTLVWLPFVGFMVNLVQKIVPGEETTIKRGLNYLDERMLETPSMALGQVKNEVIRTLDISRIMVEEATEAFLNNNHELIERVNQKEDIVNEIEEDFIKFLTRVPRSSLSEADIQKIDMYYAIIDDIESIADDAYDLVELALYKEDNRVQFSEDATKTLEDNFKFILELIDYTYRILSEKRYDFIDLVLEGEKKMDKLLLKYRQGHLDRLGQGICDPDAGIVYLEVFDSLEHISDQTADIVHSLMEK